MHKKVVLFLAATAILGVLALVVFQRSAVFAHCDTLDGPVVKDAQAALEKGDVTPVLKWVKKEHEEEVRAAFKKTLAVRGQGAEAKKLADHYFFETLVRIHRAGEGEPYTGLKPAGQVEPVVAAADKAIADGSAGNLARELQEAVEKGLRQRFARVIETKKHAQESVAAGREYVAAYVEFVHYAERIHQDAASGAAHHHEGRPPAEHENPGHHAP